MFAELTLPDGRRMLVNPAQVVNFVAIAADERRTHGGANTTILGSASAYPMYVQEPYDEVFRRFEQTDALSLLAEALDYEGEAFDEDTEVDGADLVEFFAQWRRRVISYRRRVGF